MLLEHFSRALVIASCSAVAACSDPAGDACELEDRDGIIGGEYTFVLRVDDVAFDPIVLAAQNSADVRLTLTNEGTGENGFRIDCLATPNDDGCAAESCFPDSHVIDPIAPGASQTVTFSVPEVEGIYTFRTLPVDDGRIGQFVVQ